MIRNKKALLHAASLAALLSFSCTVLSQTAQDLEPTSTDEASPEKNWDVLDPPFNLTTVAI
ncbi:MAG: hypothetical protein ACI8VY_001615, partial [Cellvibrionaceae bacterium]